MAFGRLGSLGGGFGRVGAGASGGVSAPVGGAALLEGEANGFAADFTYATDASRVAVKTAGTVVSSGLSFFTNAGVSSKWVFNAAGTLVNVAAGSLAVDYDPVTHAARGLLVEPAATNLALRSSEFDTASWSVFGTASKGTANAATAPDGTLTADAVAFTAGAGQVYVSPAGVTAAVHTLSVYAKRNAGSNQIFRLKGVVGGSDSYSADLTATAEWQRFSFTYTASAGGGIAIANGSAAGAANLLVWGAQLETGTVATSHIPTFAASVTRAADRINITPASINYSATMGSWWADVNLKTAALGNRIVGRQDSYTPLYVVGATNFGYYDAAANFNSSVVSSAVGSNKVASAFQSADRAITANGLAPVTNTAVGASFGPGTAIGIGYDANANTDQINGYIRKLRYVPRRKTNPELVSETV